MNPLFRLFCSSIGRKFLMAVTGVVLVAFVFGHLVGNLQIFTHPDHINGYAQFLQSLGPTLWIVRAVLLACLLIHVWAAIRLALENRVARGPNAYGSQRWLAAAWASRFTRLTGLVVLAFVFYHIAHFTVGAAQAENFKTHLPEYQMAEGFRLFGFPVVAQGVRVHDVYSMVFLGFSNALVSTFYIVAVGLLTVHLWHGVDSMFQTLGWRSHKWSDALRRVVGLLCLLYFLGNLAIPATILTGVLKPAAGTFAAQKLAVKTAVTVTSVASP